MKTLAIFMVALFLVCLSLSSSAAQEQKARISPPAQFNTSEKLVTSNGNLPVAMSRIKGSPPEASWQGATEITLEQITKSPYSYLGKICLFSGIVSEIEEMPPNQQLPGKWYDVAITALNKNSAFGVITIEIIYHGDATGINPESHVVFAGYFVGAVKTQNGMGAPTENLVFVSNAIKNAGTGKGKR